MKSDRVVAGPLALLEEDSPGSPLTSMLQALNRFFTEKIVQDFKSMPPYDTTFDQVISQFLRIV